MKERLLSVQNLTKQRGSQLLLRRVSFECRRGEVVGILGPQGEGKQALFSLLSGASFPDEGSITLGGWDLAARPEEARSGVAFLPEHPVFFLPRGAGWEELEFSRRLRGTEGPFPHGQVLEWAGKLGLAEKLDQRCDRLSLAEQKQLALVRALAEGVRLLVCEEPNAGYGPAEIRRTREFIRACARHEERAFLLFGHSVAEAEAVCDRIAVLADGRLGGFRMLREEFSPEERRPYRISAFPIEAARACLAEAGLGQVLALYGECMEVLLTAEEWGRLNRMMAEQGIHLHRVEPLRFQDEDGFE